MLIMFTPEQCLDAILLKLKKNWSSSKDRKPLEAEKLMQEFGLPSEWQKHEFFIGLVDKLIKDGYADLLPNFIPDPRQTITTYQQDTIITVEGYYFINDGGYVKQKSISASENTRLANIENEQMAHQRWMTYLTIVLTVGTLMQAILCVVELYWHHGWFAGFGKPHH